MALSPQWSESLIVLPENNDVVRRQQPPSSACAYADVGYPITVRPRDERLLTVVSSCYGSNVGEENCSSDNASTSRTYLPQFASLFTGHDISKTFWVPNVIRNDMGLLEAIHRRTAANRTYVLLQSRPLPELQFNFSTCTGNNIDLSHPVFRLSKTAIALMQFERNVRDDDEIVIPTSTHSDRNGDIDNSDVSSWKHGLYSPSSSKSFGLSGKVFKHKLREGLRSINEEEYYLVRYRDYSAWAVQQYADIAKKDHFWGNKYVEQCFAIHVGKEPGELIPITEAQFLFGVEIMQRQLLEQVGMGVNVDINYSSLDKYQFRSLGALLGDGMRDVGVDGEERLRLENAKKKEEMLRHAARLNCGEYVPPSIWDWSPSAIKKRIDHQLQMQYYVIGRFVVRSTVFAVAAYLLWSYIRTPLSYSGSNRNYDNDTIRNNGRVRRQNRWGMWNDSYRDDLDQYVPKGFLRSVLFGPKEVFDYLLAPR